MARAQLTCLLEECLADFLRLIRPPWTPLGAVAKGLASYFKALLYHWDIEAPPAPAMIPLDLLLMDQELQTILDTHCHGATSANLCLIPSHCLCHLLLPALSMLAP